MPQANEPKERVALELLAKIAEGETGLIKEKNEKPREYYLTLYSQCLRIVSGEDVDDVLEDDAD